MDLHVLIVIACVFLASLFSILFINKFFKSKTYEEAAAEKRAIVEKLYSSATLIKSNKKSSRKNILNKKDSKREKKRHLQHRETTENDSSDNLSVDSHSVESSPTHGFIKKLHVGFSEPEIVHNIVEQRISNSKSTGLNLIESKPFKQRKASTSKHSGGILVNKTDQIIITDQTNDESLNNFEIKHPKDVEPKKTHQQNFKDADSKQHQILKYSKKSNKLQQKININAAVSNLIEDLTAPHDTKSNDEKKNSVSANSPKSYAGISNRSKINFKKKDKELSLLFDKVNVSSTETIGVNYLMSLVSRAELNRSDIQILIDYLLNKQQDSILVTHSEWSDDIVQKLRKQLNEKEIALLDEQATLVGMQAKLRDLRNEINAERVNINITQKAYLEDINAKNTEIQNLSQELQNLNEKFQIECNQYQAKIRHEKQTNSQDFLAQIQQLNECNNLLQNDLHQKTSLVNDLQLMLKASHQTVEQHANKLSELNDICQQQKQTVIHLEQRLSDAEKKQLTFRKQYDLEIIKVVEKEKDLNKVEIRNLQNALDSTKAELNLIKNELVDSKNKVDIVTKQLNESVMNCSLITNRCQEQIKTSCDLQDSLANYKNLIDEKDEIISELKLTSDKVNEMIKLIEEQKLKNNDLRTKNWKLVEALKNAESTPNIEYSSSTSNNKIRNNLVTQVDKEDQKLRNLLKRLYPNDIKYISESTIDDFVEHIIAGQNVTPTISKCEHFNTNNFNDSHKNNNLEKNQIELKNISIIDSNTDINRNSMINSNSCSSSSSNNYDTQTLLLQNVQFRTHIDELTKIVNKTENMLTNLETHAREQDAYWQGIVKSKQDEINKLKSSNGEEKSLKKN